MKRTYKWLRCVAKKTDKSDAYELAKSHFRVKRRQTYQEEEYYQQMRGLTRYYDELDSEITHLFSPLHGILQLSFQELERLFRKRSALFLNIVQLYPHPDEGMNALLESAKNSYPAISREDVRCE